MKFAKLIIFFSSIVLILVALAAYTFFYKNGSEIIPVQGNLISEHVVQLSVDYISQKNAIELFGVDSVLYVSDDYYRFKLDEEKMQKLKTLNYPYVELPNSHTLADNGMAIWKVEIKEPVYSQKLQILANYGTIINEYDKGYLLWLNKNRTEEVQKLEDVKLIRPYYNYEKISPEVSANYSESQKSNANVYLLIDNKNLSAIKNKLGTYNVLINSESNTTFLGQSLEAVSLNLEFYYSNLNDILENIPQIVKVDVLTKPE